MIKNLFNHFIDSFFEERQRWFLWLPVLFALGIAIYFSLPFEPNIWLGLVLFEIMILFAFISRFRPFLVFLSICLITVLSGFSYMQMRNLYVQAPYISKAISFAKVSARVIKIEKFPSSYRVLFDNVKISGVEKNKTPKKIRVKFNFPNIKFKNGSFIAFNARLTPPSAPSIAGGYNFAKKAWFEQIGAVGFSFSKPKRIRKNIKKSYKDKFLFFIDDLRKQIVRKIYKVLPNQSGKICASLIAGERGEIPRNITDDYRDSGLAHMLSISGLHMGLFASLVYFFVRLLLSLIPFISQNFNIKKIASFFAILAITGYLFISGMRIPSQRAYFMTIVVLLGILFDRRAISIRLIMWAGFVVLLFQPEALISPSFQMSFAAVIALVASYEAGIGKFINFFSSHSRAENPMEFIFRIISAYVAGILVSDFIASFATMPFAIYHFNRVAVYTLLGNFLAAPFFGIIVMPCAVLSLFLSFVGLEKYPLLIMGLGVEKLNDITNYVSSLSNSVILVSKMPSLALGLIAIGGIWICLWEKKWRLLGVIPIVLACFIHYKVKIPDAIVNENGEVFAVKIGDRLSLSPFYRGSFVKKTWLEFYGIKKIKNNKEKSIEKAIWKNKGKYNQLANKIKSDNKIYINCDYFGCVYKAKNYILAYSIKEEGLSKDCLKADIVISKNPINIKCDRPVLIIDRFDLWKKGAHSIYLEKDEIKVKTNFDDVGKRDWSIYSIRNKQK